MKSKFNEQNTVQQYIINLLKKKGWNYIPPQSIPRKTTDIIIDSYLKEALIKLNPSIKEKPDRADEVIYKLRAILLSVHSDGLVRANEEFTSWLKGERSMPFGRNNQHVTVHLIDFENIHNNHCVITEEYDLGIKRPDIILIINGLPLVVGECKTPLRPAISWFDGASQINEDYELSIPALFVPNVFSFATEGKEFKYGSIRAPLEKWSPWKNDDCNIINLNSIEPVIRDMLRPEVILDILNNFTIFATGRKNRKIKIICRHQQYEAANKIIERVIEGKTRKGLIWHFQGSGKSLLMLFTAQKLRLHPHLKSPTVMIVVDRLELDTQITSTFNASDVPNTIAVDNRKELKELLERDIRKIIITTIHKFKEADTVLNERNNIIVMVDEAHRTQEGDLGIRMRTALPNAFFFGLTGTPINKKDRNTFITFGAEEDERGYLSRYSFEDSLRDEATLPLHFEPRLVEMHIDRETIDEEISTIIDDLSEEEASEISKRAGKMATIVRNPERIKKVAEDIIKHYRNSVDPEGFKAMVVSYDRQSCVDYKSAFDKILPEEYTDIVMTVNQRDPVEWKKRWSRKKEEEEEIRNKFNDPDSSLKILIVTAKLLAGFDAPILQTMYMDKILKDHTLLQAVCRTNRPYRDKTHGLIVDYIGIFDNIAKTLTYNEENIRDAINNFSLVRNTFYESMDRCLRYFPHINRTIPGYEGLIAAQECLPDNETRDEFAADYSILSKLWEAISPDTMLNKYRADYKWLTHVYESVQPADGQGKLIWHALGAKTLEIINQNIQVEAIRDDLEKIVLDKEMVEELVKNNSNAHKMIEIKLITRLRKHREKQKFIALGKKLEELKERYEQGFLNSLEYLKTLLSLAREVLEAEREADSDDERNKAKAALTELFHETKNPKTPKMIERIVDDIDSMVRTVRFEGWKWTNAGEREVKQALRKTLLKYKLHKEQDLFDRAYAYLKEYY
jgi:type I restriction enzyme R subunit